MFAIDSVAFLGQEFLEVVVTRAKFVLIGDRDLAQVFLLEFEPEPIVGPVHEACQVHSERSASGGRFSSMAWRIVSAAVARPWTWRFPRRPRSSPL